MAIPWGAIIRGVNVLGNVATSIGSITNAAKNITGSFGGWGVAYLAYTDKKAKAKAWAEIRAKAKAADKVQQQAKVEQTTVK